jgi:hypothetical protein
MEQAWSRHGAGMEQAWSGLKWISIGMQTDKKIDHQPRQLTTRIELHLGYDGHLSPVS